MLHNKYITLIVISLQIVKLYFVKTEEIAIFNIPKTVGHNHVIPYSLLNSKRSLCLSNSKHVECSSKAEENLTNPSSIFVVVTEKPYHLHNLNVIKSLVTDVRPILKRIPITREPTAMNMNPSIHTSNIMYPIQTLRHATPFAPVPKLNMMLYNNQFVPPINQKPGSSFSQISSRVNSFSQHSKITPTVALHSEVTKPPILHPFRSPYEKFARSLDNFERQFYMITFIKLTSISPPNRQVNGMSFVQSGFFLQLTLMTLSMEVDSLTKDEINKAIGYQTSGKDIKTIIRPLISSLPGDSQTLRFRRVSRLVLWPGREPSPKFCMGPADALRLGIDVFNGTEKPEQIHTILNKKIEKDSGGAIRDTFDENDISGGVTAVLITTLYFRARWRTAPTVLNGTWPFHDADDATARTVRMMKLNDIMGYADIKECNAQALEIPYASPQLSLVIIVPRQSSLKNLADYVAGTSICNITSRMKKMRVAATLPLYTLRMTLLLPNKLQAMGVSRLFDTSNLKPGDPLRLSHMVQRIMFWAEAGRNAYKDDGLEWDETPDMQIRVDRPYIFFVRWRNITLMNGNFVL